MSQKSTPSEEFRHDGFLGVHRYRFSLAYYAQPRLRGKQDRYLWMSMIQCYLMVNALFFIMSKSGQRMHFQQNPCFMADAKTNLSAEYYGYL